MDFLKDKVILISGSSRGIGRATAERAKEYRATVVLHGHEESEGISALAKDLGCEYIVCDVRDKQKVVEKVDEIVSRLGKIDGLVNSAGIVKPKPFLDLDDKDWEDELNTNILGTVHFCQAVIPHMRKQKRGRIVNVASIRGHAELASARGIPYSVSKAGIVSLTSALAKEYAPEIAVNAVSPGFTETDMAKAWNETTWEQARSALLGRPGKPNEIAETILFLISDRSSFMTGQTVLVDGGYAISGK